MRITLTIDDYVAAKLEDELKRSGGSFKELVNDVLRTGMDASPLTVSEKVQGAGA